MSYLVVLLLVFSMFSILFFCPFILGESQGWKVDVFVQGKQPNGTGLEEACDAFKPEETVILNANITYNEHHVQRTSVSFIINGPINQISNYTLSLTAVSNESGIALANFTIPWPSENPETIVFGEWAVIAFTENASDSMTFMVGWLVDITSLTAIESDPPQGGWLDVQAFITTIAITPKNVTLAIISTDSDGNFINTRILEGIIVNSTGLNVTVRVIIPLWASVGTATAEGSVFTPYGEPYSPTILSTNFQISLLGDLTGDNQIDMQDIGIVTLAFGSYPGHNRWNPLSDINKDFIVNMFDVALISRNFGTVYP